MIDRAFWRGRRVLITGHTGFKGSWLSTWLLDLEADVHGVALAPGTDPSMFELTRLGARMPHTIADLRDPGTSSHLLETSRPEVVFHLAAQGIVRRALRDPVTTFETNVMGTVHLLEAVRQRADVKAVVVVTSDKCYAVDAQTSGYREEDPLGGAEPYSASKASQEMVAHAFERCYLTGRVATARAGNVIGGGDWAEDRLVPDAVRAWSAALPLRLRNPRAVRPWQHVLDPLAGYLRLAERLSADRRFAGPWNFAPAPGDAVPVATLVERLQQCWGSGSWSIDDDPDAARETPVLRLNASRAQERLGWRPRLRLAEALAWSVEWYRDVTEHRHDAFELSRVQIRRYEHLEAA
jgi:CDP-glucose 4,6-dehydratase